MSASSWVAAAQTGYCNPTAPTPGDCNAGVQGAWNIGWSSQNWSASAAYCVQRCEACARCRFVSVKRGRKYGECSWYAHCKLNSLHQDSGWLSGAVAPQTAEALALRARSANETTARRELIRRAFALVQCKDDPLSPHLFTSPRRGCTSAVYPPRHLWPLLLRQLHHCSKGTPLAAWSAPLLADMPIAMASRAYAASLPRRALTTSCLSAACIANRLDGGWTMLMGDSTQRSLFEELEILLTHLGYKCERHGPAVHGRTRFAADDRQKDYDTLCTWSSGSGRTMTHTLSLRFLRGLDELKLEQNARAWSRRLLYVGWRSRARRQHGNELLLESDDDGFRVSHRREPSVVLLHHAAWLIPRSILGGWSRFFYPEGRGAMPQGESVESLERSCAAAPATVAVLMKTDGGAEAESTARVVAGSARACQLLRRARTKGHGAFNTTSAHMYAAAREGLEAALRTIRTHFNGHLWLRSAFAGTRDGRIADGLKQNQGDEIEQMDAILRKVARTSCVGFLDVYELDQLTGGFEHMSGEHFHSPQSAERQAATAALLWLRALPKSSPTHNLRESPQTSPNLPNSEPNLLSGQHTGRRRRLREARRISKKPSRACALSSRPLHGSWQKQPPSGSFGETACLDGSRRGAPAYFKPHNCTLQRRAAGTLSGSIMMIGDSLMQYQFDALLAWQKRAGTPLRCRPFDQSTLVTGVASMGDGTAATAVRALMTAAKYTSHPQDCTRQGLSMYMRRLNLLPIADAHVRSLFDHLVAPLGTDGIVIINVGLWYGAPLSRKLSGDSAAALEYLHRGVASLARAACARRAWPHILWREHTPQHFGGGGEYNASSSAAHAGCQPLSQPMARAMYLRVSRPALRALRLAGERRRCHRTIGVLPTFWPLVPRFRDHEGFRSAREGSTKSDCTHWMPCSGAMMLLNQLLVDGVAAVRARLAGVEK